MADEAELLAKLEAQNLLLEQDNRAVVPGFASVPGTPAASTANNSRASSPSLSIGGGGSNTALLCDAESQLAEWSTAMANWEAFSKKKLKRLTELVHLGVPAPLRCMVWQLLGNRMSETVVPGYSDKDKPDYAGLLEQSSPHEKYISRDIARTYPTHSFFSEKEGMGQEVLFNVIKAYSLFDTEVGYCQGSPFIVGLLLMHMPEEEAFYMLIQLMQHYKLRGLFVPSMSDLPLKLYQFDSLLQSLEPAVYDHLEQLGVESSSYASQWFLTLFGNTLPLPLVFRVLDIFLLEGITAIFRTSIAIMRCNADFICRQGFEQSLKLLTKDGLRERFESEKAQEELMSTIRDVKVTPKRLVKCEKEYATLKAKAAAERSELAVLKAKNASLSEENQALHAKV